MELDKVDLNKLRTFAAVAEAGGVSGAARQLSLTRSAVSQSLAALESSLGIRLFDRVGKRLVPTHEGRTLAREFGRAHEELRSALALVMNEERAIRGVVRLGLFPGASRTRVAKLVATFAALHPEARVRLAFASHAELREQLIENRIDFALSLRGGEPASPRIRSSVLFRQKLVLVSSERAPRGRLDPIWLAERPVIDYFPANPLIARWFAHQFPRRRMRAKIRVWAATTDMALELALLGAGAVVLPHSLALPQLRAGRLHAIRGPRADLDDPVWLEESEGAWRSAMLEAFRAVLVSELGDPE